MAGPSFFVQIKNIIAFVYGRVRGKHMREKGSERINSP
jgi:hypothetical protein